MRLKLYYNNIAAMLSPLIGPHFATLRKTATLKNIPSRETLVRGFVNLNWKRLLNLGQDQVIGLDIGSSAVKMVQLQKNNNTYTVTAAAIANINNADESNDSSREINIARAIHKCFESATTQTQLAVCSICGPEVAIRYFKFPPLPPDEIEPAVLFEAEQVCPFNVHDGVVDYQLIPDGEDNISGILVAATNELIERKKRLVEDAFLATVLMDIDGLALLNCFTGYERHQTDQPTAILNVGSSFTNLAIMSSSPGGNAVPFIRDISYASDGIVKHIATEHNLPAQTVRKILTSSETLTQPETELGDSLARACQQLITDIAETLRYYTAQEKSAAVEKILVCGGFSLVKGFVELLDNQLPAAAVLWNPFDRIHCAPDLPCKDIIQKTGPAMAVAAGLAMRSI